MPRLAAQMREFGANAFWGFFNTNDVKRTLLMAGWNVAVGGKRTLRGRRGTLTRDSTFGLSRSQRFLQRINAEVDGSRRGAKRRERALILFRRGSAAHPRENASALDDNVGIGQLLVGG